MAMLPYPALGSDDEELARVHKKARRRRSGKLLNLYRMLLHSPSVCEGWLGAGTAVRYETSLPGVVREGVVCLVARLTDCSYEWEHHRPLALAEGFTERQLDALPDLPGEEFPDKSVLLALEHARRVVTGDRATGKHLAGLRREFDDQQVVELTALAAFYTATARFLVALGIDLEEGIGA